MMLKAVIGDKKRQIGASQRKNRKVLNVNREQKKEATGEGKEEPAEPPGKPSSSVHFLLICKFCHVIIISIWL